MFEKKFEQKRSKYIDGCRGVDSKGASTGLLTGGPTKV